MIPSTVWGLAFFGILVAPGLLFDLLMHKHKARAAASPFREASWVVLTSFLFSGAAFAGLYGLTELKQVPGVLRPEDWAGADESFIANHFGAVLLSSGLLLGASCGFAGLAYLYFRPDGKRLIDEPAWVKAFRTDNPGTDAPLARVKLHSGSVFIGTLAEYSVAYEREDRELVLAPPLHARSVGGKMVAMPDVWQRIVIAGPDIESIAVGYGDGTVWKELGL